MRCYAVHLLAAGSILSFNALAQAPGVSLAVSDEIVPAGGVAQIKVFLTEPKPIIRTGMVMDLNATFIDEVLGISAAGGATGVAQYSNGRLRIEVRSLSPAPVSSDYPIVTIAIRLPALPPGRRGFRCNSTLATRSGWPPADSRTRKRRGPAASRSADRCTSAMCCPAGGRFRPAKPSASPAPDSTRMRRFKWRAHGRPPLLPPKSP